MTTYTNNRPTYKEIFGEILRLSLRDQRRLHAELEKLTGVRLIRPVRTTTAVQAGKMLAEEVRKELRSAIYQSLDDAMYQLRGRSWL